jgi:hypothetical protein
MKFLLLFSLFPLIQAILTWKDLNVDGESFGPHLITGIPQQLKEKKRLNPRPEKQSPGIESMKDESKNQPMEGSKTDSNPTLPKTPIIDPSK